MNQKIFFIAAALLLLTACGALRARKITLPEEAALESVTITAGGLELTATDEAFIAQLLELLGQSRNTGRDSVQDMPSKGAGLVRIDFGFKKGGTGTLFLYREGEKLLMEQPYQGIYELDGSVEYELRTQIALQISEKGVA